MRQFRPIRRSDVKKLSIVRNPGTGPLLERLREPVRHGQMGFRFDPLDRRTGETPEQHFERLSGCSFDEYMAEPPGGK